MESRFFLPEGGIETLGKIGDVFGQNMYNSRNIRLHNNDPLYGAGDWSRD
jgi:hypothetical protein